VEKKGETTGHESSRGKEERRAIRISPKGCRGLRKGREDFFLRTKKKRKRGAVLPSNPCPQGRRKRKRDRYRGEKGNRKEVFSCKPEKRRQLPKRGGDPPLTQAYGGRRKGGAIAIVSLAEKKPKKDQARYLPSSPGEGGKKKREKKTRQPSCLFIIEQECLEKKGKRVQPIEPSDSYFPTSAGDTMSRLDGLHRQRWRKSQ